MAEPDDVAAELDALGDKLDRITYLLGALLALQTIHLFGGAIAELSVAALLALVAASVVVLLGLADAF